MGLRKNQHPRTSSICDLFTIEHTPKKPSAIAFVDAQYSASAQDVAVDFCHTLQFFTPTLPIRNPHQDTHPSWSGSAPSLAARGDAELDKRVQTGLAHTSPSQAVVGLDLHATRSCPLQFRSLKVMASEGTAPENFKGRLHVSCLWTWALEGDRWPMKERLARTAVGKRSTAPKSITGSLARVAETSFNFYAGD